MYKKKIGVNAFPLTREKAGIGFYIFYLLDELIRLHPECYFLLYVPNDEGDIKHFLRYENVTIRVCSTFQFSHIFWLETVLAFCLWKDRIDLFWATTQSIPFFKRKKTKTFLSLYDFTFLIAPHTMTFLFRSYFKLSMRQVLKQADYIFPISYGTAQKLKEFYGHDYHGVVHPPLKNGIALKSRSEVEAKLNGLDLIYNGYILSVGTLEPRKNFAKLLEIYQVLLQKHSLDKLLPLVLVGGGGWKNQNIKELIAETKKQYPSHLKYLGYLSDEQLSFFLSGAKCYLTLSLYEGYGMPLAEARICGTPISCFDQPEMKEAAENEGIFLNVNDLESQLESIFLSKNSSEEKQSLMTNYLSNQEKAKIFSKAIYN